jgi:anti-anti-sigma regulatory factor
MDTTPPHVDAQTSADPPRRSVGVEVRAAGNHLLLVVSGEADQYSSQALRDELGAALAHRPRSVAVEVSRLTYCDRAGLDALNDFCAEASIAGVPVVIHGIAPPAGVGAFPAGAVDRRAAPEDRSVTRESLPFRHEPASPATFHPSGVAAMSAAPPRPWPVR